VGNRTSMTSSLSGVPGGTFSYDNNDRLNIDTWDANGNTTSSGSITNIYDFENRMTQHGSVQLQYDGDGNRVSETAGGVTTKYLVDTLNPTKLPQVVDETVSGSVTRTYAYGLQRISENQLVGSTWTPSFYGYDGHGNVRFLTNSAGTITDSYDYDAFGMPIRTSGTTANSFLYSGERYDSSVGLYDLRARYYNQATGRFWAMDPMEHKCCGQSWDQNTMWSRDTARNPGTVKLWVKAQQMRGTRCCGSCSPLQFNPYIYADDDPVNRTDPAGTEAFEEYELNTFRREAEEVSAQKLAYRLCVSTCQAACESILTYDPYVPWTAIAWCKNACWAECRSIFPN
jgi:RHS repeat-associated protein